MPPSNWKWVKRISVFHIDKYDSPCSPVPESVELRIVTASRSKDYGMTPDMAIDTAIELLAASQAHIVLKSTRIERLEQRIKQLELELQQQQEENIRRSQIGQ